jgi:hypothetical protein
MIIKSPEMTFTMLYLATLVAFFVLGVVFII